MERVSVLILKDIGLNKNLIRSLELNKEFIKEVLLVGNKEEFKSFKRSDLPVKIFERELSNRAEQRNFLVNSATSELLLFVTTGTELEDTTLEELLEVYDESKADIIYPNIIFKFKDEEKIENYSDAYGKELDLLTTLKIEDYLPEWGVLAKKSIFEELGMFNENLEDFEFYEFIYRNIKSLKLKLSELSFVVQEMYESFIDTSIRSFVIRSAVLKQYDWRKEIFPFLSWDKNPNIAEATALTIIGNVLATYYDYYNASDYYRKALLTFHNQETLKNLIKVYTDMGLFEEVKKLIHPSQGMKEEEKEKTKFYVDKISELINELEEEVRKGNLVEVLVVLQDVVKFYSGAPVHNVLGVINWMQKRREDAYKFFFKAVTMNPINNDYLYNLATVAKDIGREKAVEKLIHRLVEL